MNETLSDLEPIRKRFEQLGLPGHVLELWFAATLRDGFALTAAGAYAPFRDVASDVLRGLLAHYRVDGDPETAVSQLLAGFGDLPPHPDIAPGLRRIHAAGIRLVTLTNGATAFSDQLLDQAGVLPLLEHRLSVDEPQKWKPDPDAYRYAVEVCGIEPAAMALAAVHPWDVDGARRAGLTGIWVDRTQAPYPKVFLPPDLRASDFEALATQLTSMQAGRNQTPTYPARQRSSETHRRNSAAKGGTSMTN